MALADKSLRQILWPGSHDAGTGSFHPPYTLVPDRPANQTIYKIWKFLDRSCLLQPIANTFAGLINSQAKTQTQPIYGQLLAGSRYFDLRLWRNPSGEIHLSHGIIGPSINSVLKEVDGFLNEHPDELVILHERQREPFNHSSYLAYIESVKNALGEKLVPKIYSVSTTYGDLMKTPHRVIYIAPDSPETDPPVDPVHFRGDPLIWSDKKAITEWPNAQSVQKIIDVFDRTFRSWSNHPSTLCIAQMVFSPTNQQYFSNILRGETLHSFSRQLNPALPQIFNSWATDKQILQGMNVFMLDFVNDSSSLIKYLINLNISKNL